MGLTSLAEADYLAALQALLPPGPAWPDLGVDCVEARQLGPLAAELARLDAQAAALFDELDPRTATVGVQGGGVPFERLEALLGLPDACTLAFSDDAPTPESRRAAVLAKLREQGGQTLAYFIDVAAAMRYAVTITEFSEVSCEEMDVDDEILDEQWAHAWMVHVSYDSEPVDMTVDDAVDSPISDFPVVELLECVINRLAPAHTAVLFSYA